MERAVPAMVRAAASTSNAFMSANFSRAMSRQSSKLMVPTISEPISEAFLDLGFFHDQSRSGRALDFKLERAVFEHRHDTADQFAVEFAGGVVELGDELSWVHAIGTQNWSQRRCRRRLPTGSHQFELSSDLLGHRCFSSHPVPSSGPWRGPGHPAVRSGMLPHGATEVVESPSVAIPKPIATVWREVWGGYRALGTNRSWVRPTPARPCDRRRPIGPDPDGRCHPECHREGGCANQAEDQRSREWPIPEMGHPFGQSVDHFGGFTFQTPRRPGQAGGGDQVGGHGRQPGVFKFTGFRGQVGGGGKNRIGVFFRGGIDGEAASTTIFRRSAIGEGVFVGAIRTLGRADHHREGGAGDGIETRKWHARFSCPLWETVPTTAMGRGTTVLIISP